MAFVQIIEFRTSRIDEVLGLMEEWLAATEGKRKAQRSVLTQDRDRPGTYLQMVDFPSYEEAMANSALPETASFAERIAKLCDGPLSFRNLDVERSEQMS